MAPKDLVVSRGFRLICLWLLLTLATSAESWHAVTIYTSPAGAEVVDTYGNVVGRTGESLNLDLSRYGSTLEVLIRLQGCHPYHLSIRTSKLKKLQRIPEVGVLLLQPSSRWQALRFAVQEHPWLWLTVALSLVALVTSLARWRLRLAGQAERHRALETVGVAEPGSLTFRRVHNYILGRRLGRGGAATVYAAVHADRPQEGEQVAIKILHREISDNPEIRDRFLREIKIGAGLSHPAIMSLLDWGEFSHRGETRHYLVTELLGGSTLRDQVGLEPLEPELVLNYVRQLIAALDFAHRKGVIHRDLKPDNIWLLENDKIKLMDFGLASHSGGARLTQTGTALGTPAYMAPEQIRGAAPSASMDQYSLGILAYRLLTGRLPFESGEPVEVIYQHLEEEVPPLTEFGLWPEISEVVQTMLAKDANRRFYDLEEALSAWEAAFEERGDGV